VDLAGCEFGFATFVANVYSWRCCDSGHIGFFLPSALRGMSGAGLWLAECLGWNLRSIPGKMCGRPLTRASFSRPLLTALAPRNLSALDFVLHFSLT
jgi:hypothetical protein